METAELKPAGIMQSHEYYMQMALAEARKADAIEEVPVGAVLVSGAGEILAAAHNRAIAENDPTGHAEILALRRAAEKLQNYRLLNTTLYVSIEPCIMCVGAMVHGRVARLVYGAPDPRWGAAGSLYNVAADSRLNHQVDVVSGVCAAECRQLIQDFFRSRRIPLKSHGEES
jgi:tRNA(adenine34) deaminase